MEGNPHSVIEGMLIGAYAMGIHQGFVYIRAEYPLAVKNLRLAIQQAEALGLLGKDILQQRVRLHIECPPGGWCLCVRRGNCPDGIHRRTHRRTPSAPALPGGIRLVGQTHQHQQRQNLGSGADHHPAGRRVVCRDRHREKQRHDDLFRRRKDQQHRPGRSADGHHPAPVDLRYRRRHTQGKAFKAAQIGGPSGGCLPAEHLDVPIDYESLTSLGAIVGSGGLVVADEDTCMVDFARYFMTFTQQESCGKCVPCRIGTKAMLETLTKICDGDGEPGDLEYLDELGAHIKQSSLCALGQTAPNPVLSTIRYFRDEYEAHILEKRCPAKVCKALITYRIDAEKCTGCMVCLRNCTSNAIQGEKQKVHVIDTEKCIRCGVCMNMCKFDAVLVE